MMKKFAAPLLVLIFCLCRRAATFEVGQQWRPHNPTSPSFPLVRPQPHHSGLFSSSSITIDFEYEPPNPGANYYNSIYQTDLSSAYPPGTPSGLRGEAVRSALRSGQCIAYKFDQTPLQHGLLRVQGQGTLNFLNNKLSNKFAMPSSSSQSNSCGLFRAAALLTARGRMIDRVGVAVLAPSSSSSSKPCAYIQTSPRHKASDLFARLDPFVFPLDQVKLEALGDDHAFGFTLASIQRKDVIRAFDKFVRPKLGITNDIQLPTILKECLAWHNPDNGSLQLLAMPTVDLPDCAAAGYTFWYFGKDNDDKVGQTIWQTLTSDANSQGPVAIGPLEYESLRIQAGQPGFGFEMTGRDEKTSDTTPATPLELHAGSDVLIDTDKGCYMGQEGIASILKNPRGPPRLLYQVVFGDEFNLYDSETAGEAASSTAVENLTRLPQPGDTLYVLGSNEEIAVGTLTSVAEPGSSGDPETLGLALVRRADSILKSMQARDLAIPRVYDITEQQDSSSGIIQPPPMDPLDGLEVILQGTFTVGTLRSIPSRRFAPGRNMFDEDVPDFVNDWSLSDQDDSGSEGSARVTRVPLAEGRASGDVYEPRPKRTRDTQDEIPTWTNNEEEDAIAAEWERDDQTDSEPSNEDKGELELEQARIEAEAAQKAAEVAAAEAERKAAKMEMLRKRAEEAMAKRKAKQKGQK